MKQVDVKYAVERRGYTGSSRGRKESDIGGKPATPAELDALGFYRYDWDPS